MPEDVDDPSIGDTHELWRRIHPQWVIKTNDPPGFRPSSQAFQNRPNTNAISVLLGDEHGNPEGAVSGAHTEYSLVTFPASLARELKQAVSRAPEPDEPSHAHVTGTKTGSVQKAFVRGSSWKVLRPPA